MEINSDKILKECIIHISKTVRPLNIFSVFASIAIIIMVILGIAMVAFGSTLDSSTPHYADDLVSFAGIGLIIAAAALVPALVLLRHTFRAAREVQKTHEEYAVNEYLRHSKIFWHYFTLILIIGVGAAIICGGIAALFISSSYHFI